MSSDLNVPPPPQIVFCTIRNIKFSFKRSSIYLCPTPLPRFSYLPPSMHKFGPFFLHLFIFIFLQDQKKREGSLSRYYPLSVFLQSYVSPWDQSVAKSEIRVYFLTWPQNSGVLHLRRNVNKTNDFIWLILKIGT